MVYPVRVGSACYQQEWYREEKPSSLDEGFFVWGEDLGYSPFEKGV